MLEKLFYEVTRLIYLLLFFLVSVLGIIIAKNTLSWSYAYLGSEVTTGVCVFFATLFVVALFRR